MTPLLPPGEVMNSLSRSQVSATRSTSSASSRCAAISGDSPVMSRSPCRQLPVARAHRVTVLLDQQHAIALVHREHRHGTRVIDEVAQDGGAAELERLAPYIPDPPIEHALTGEHRGEVGSSRGHHPADPEPEQAITAGGAGVTDQTAEQRMRGYRASVAPRCACVPT